MNTAHKLARSELPIAIPVQWVSADMPPRPPGFWFRSWRYWRRLIRRRQESSMVAEVRREAANQVRDIAEKLQAVNRKLADKENVIDRKDAKIDELADVRIPQLECRIKVLEHELELMAALRERELARIEADTAAHQQRESEAETWQQRMLAGR